MKELVRVYPCYGKELAWEVCNGKSDISSELLDRFRVITFDIDPAMGPTFVADMTRDDNWAPHLPRPEFVITNPPFNCALPIVQQGVEKAKWAAAFLLRLSFLEPTFDRGGWLRDNPPTRIIVLPRISFTEDGKTDSVTCAWMIWDKRFADSREVPSGIKVVAK